MKGQVSTELLVIVGFVLLIFIPLLVLVYLKANDANQQIASYQAELAVSRLGSLANSIGSLGTSSEVITDVYVPPNTVSLSTNDAGRGGEIVLKIETGQGQTEIVEVVKYPIDGVGTIVDKTTAGGWVKIKISSTYQGTGNEAHIKIERVI
ncbi:Uncharacterised protein [Candidatus Bilamarchaeum dharawalense]|uniref:Class III signal peptide n=1 Tax=Candidatus Bilamarchaeum dharawalense TaxID=2885759 RepID=A0A5E4LPJ6_9ARCH|nr:Uncharacterised protein [Candidatus Bilamarchaeum dharawalense]